MKFRLPFGPSQDAHLDGELLSAYLDGQVKPDERRRVETHLGTCPACQSELASLRQTVTMLHALPRVPVPRAFTLSEAQVGLRRPAPAGRPTWFGGMARGLVAVSAVALVAVMAAVLLRQPSWQPSQNLAQLAAPAPAASAPAASGHARRTARAHRRRGHRARRTDGYRQSPESCWRFRRAGYSSGVASSGCDKSACASGRPARRWNADREAPRKTRRETRDRNRRGTIFGGQSAGRSARPAVRSRGCAGDTAAHGSTDGRAGCPGCGSRADRDSGCGSRRFRSPAWRQPRPARAA